MLAEPAVGADRTRARVRQRVVLHREPDRIILGAANRRRERIAMHDERAHAALGGIDFAALERRAAGQLLHAAAGQDSGESRSSFHKKEDATEGIARWALPQAGLRPKPS